MLSQGVSSLYIHIVYNHIIEHTRGKRICQDHFERGKITKEVPDSISLHLLSKKFNEKNISEIEL